MAKRRGRARGYRGNPYNAKAYQFTARRRAALKKAQLKSARKKKMTGVAVGVMAAGGVATALYLGRNTSVGKSARSSVAGSVSGFSPAMAKARNAMAARMAVQPDVKEATRMAGATSPADAPRDQGGTAPDFISMPHTPGDATGTDAKPAKGTKLPNGATKGDPSTYSRTDMGDPSAEDVQSMRDTLENKALWQQHMGHFEKFASPEERGVFKKILAGKQVNRSEFREALKKTSANKAASGAEGMSHQDMEDFLDAMVINGQLKTNIHGRQAAARRYPKADFDPTLPNSGVTAAENAGVTPTEPQHNPVTNAGGGFITMPGNLGNAQSPFGTKAGASSAPGVTTPPPSSPADAPKLTPAQKGALTRARNRAAKEAAAAAAAAGVPSTDAKPPEQPTTQAHSAAAPESQAHAPSAATPRMPHNTSINTKLKALDTLWGNKFTLGQELPEWDVLDTNQRRATKKAAERQGLYINFKTGLIRLSDKKT